MFSTTITSEMVNDFIAKALNASIDLGGRIIAALIIFIIGKYLINWANKLFAAMLQRRKVDASIQSFLKSIVNITLLVMLFLAVIGKLGIELTSFAALLASVGVAVGMALSGNLSNFAGGVIILVFRPYKVGDYIEASTGASGTVTGIQIFHTVLTTPDNKIIFAPNGAMSSAVVTNYSRKETRRLDFTFGVEYDFANGIEISVNDLAYVLDDAFNAVEVAEGNVIVWDKAIPETFELQNYTFEIVELPYIDEWSMYKFGLNQVNLGKVLYLNGEMNGYYMATTENFAEAIDVYAQLVEGGYVFYTMNADYETKYITMAVSGTHINVVYADESEYVFKYDAACKCWYTNINGTNYYFGTYNNFNTVSASKTSYINAENTGVSQFPGEWAITYTLTLQNGNPYMEEPIVEPWKCPYHNGRMCMEIIRRSK